MTLTEAKAIADNPAGTHYEEVRQALDRLLQTRANGGVRNSDRATRRLERRIGTLETIERETTPMTDHFYYYECGICGHNHPCGFDGDCRDDSNRFTDEQLEQKHGEDFTLVDMDDADAYAAKVTGDDYTEE